MQNSRTESEKKYWKLFKFEGTIHELFASRKITSSMIYQDFTSHYCIVNIELINDLNVCLTDQIFFALSRRLF